MELGWKGGEVQINGFGSVMVSPRDLREPPPEAQQNAAAGVRLPTAGKSVAIDDEHSGDGAMASPRRRRRPAGRPKDAAPTLKPVAPAHLNLELGTMTEYQPTLTPRQRKLLGVGSGTSSARSAASCPARLPREENYWELRKRKKNRFRTSSDENEIQVDRTSLPAITYDSWARQRHRRTVDMRLLPRAKREVSDPRRQRKVH